MAVMAAKRNRQVAPVHDSCAPSPAETSRARRRRRTLRQRGRVQSRVHILASTRIGETDDIRSYREGAGRIVALEGDANVVARRCSRC